MRYHICFGQERLKVAVITDSPITDETTDAVINTPTKRSVSKRSAKKELLLEPRPHPKNSQRIILGMVGCKEVNM